MLRDNEREDIFIDEEDKRVIKEFINYNKKLSKEPSLWQVRSIIHTENGEVL